MQVMKLGVLLCALALSAAPLNAQKKDSVQLTVTGNKPTVGEGGSLRKDAQIELARDQTLELTVMCSSAVDCTTVRARTDQENATGAFADSVGPRSTERARFKVTGANLVADKENFLQLVRNNAVVATFRITTTGGKADPNNKAAPVTLTDLLTRNCFIDSAGRKELFDSLTKYVQGERPFYDQSANQAWFAVTPLGNVVARPGGVIDEDDKVIVAVLADERLHPRLLVKRSSAIRDAATISIAGGGVTIPGVIRQAGEDPTRAPPVPPCALRPYVLQDFAPGEGQISLTAVDADGSEKTKTISFGVNRLYWGALSLGGMWSTMEDQSFKLTKQDTTTILAYDRNSKERHELVLMLTAWPWKKRDYEKKPSLNIHISPSIGFVLDDLTDNILGGISIDIASGVFLTGGWHLGEVKELSGATVNTQFKGTAEQIPVVTRTVAKPFYALTVDLRAAVQALTAALSAATGK